LSAQLGPLLPRQRWFGDKGRTIAGVRLRDCGALGDRAWLVLVDVTFDAGADETYAVPLVLGGDGAAPGALVMTLDLDGEAIRADDAFDDHGFCLELLTAFERGVTVPMLRHGAVRFIRTERFPTLGGAASLARRRLELGRRSSPTALAAACGRAVRACLPRALRAGRRDGSPARRARLRRRRPGLRARADHRRRRDRVDRTPRRRRRPHVRRSPRPPRRHPARARGRRADAARQRNRAALP